MEVSLTPNPAENGADETNGDEEKILSALEFDVTSLANRTRVFRALDRLRKLIYEDHRFNFALQIAEQTARYLQGYLSDYDIDVQRRIERDKITLILTIHVYNEYHTPESEALKIFNELKRIFPDADEKKLWAATEKIMNTRVRPREVVYP